MSENSTSGLVPPDKDVFDPIRYKIIKLLANEELRVLELAEKLQISPQEIETHIKVLLQAGLITASRKEHIDKHSVQQWYIGKTFKVVLDAKAAELLIHPITSQILALLVQREMPLYEIAKTLKLSKTKARYHIQGLIAAGLVVKTQFTQIRGMKVPWFVAKWKVSIPRLESLPHEADVGIYLEPLKAFIWGYLVGLGMNDEQIYKLMMGEEPTKGPSSFNPNSSLLKRAAETTELLADKDERIQGSSPDVLRFQLMAKALRLVLSEPQFQQLLPKPQAQ
ncbi:MAG: helix-turn-helix domain-containing protein [Promethearchaeota archaeon]